MKRLVLVLVLILAPAFPAATKDRACPPACSNGQKVKVLYLHHWRRATVIGTWKGNDFYIWVSIDGTKLIPLIANDRSDVRVR